MFSTLDVIQESFEDVSLDYNPHLKKNSIYGINRRSSVKSVNPSLTSSTLSLGLSSDSTNKQNSVYRTNYSTSSLSALNKNNSSKELLLTPSQKLKIIKNQRLQKSQDHLSTNSPEALNSIDFLSDDELPDNLIVFDVPSLYSLQSLSLNKRKPSIRRKNSVSLQHSLLKNDNLNPDSSTLQTNTNNINQQIEFSNHKSIHNQQPNSQHRIQSKIKNCSNTNSLSHFTSFSASYSPSSTSSTLSSPATRASSIFSRTSDIPDFQYSEDELLNPLSKETKLLSENKDFKLEETLQRMTMLKNISKVSSNNDLNIEFNNKSQYLSSTRQSNLPPKTKYEVLKHEKDFKNLLELEIYNEKENLINYQLQRKKLLAQHEKDTSLWLKVVNNYDTLIKLPKTRELWWRYIPAKYRSKIWKKQLMSKKKTIFDNTILKNCLKEASITLNDACNFKSVNDELAKKKIIKDNPKILEDIEYIEKCSDKLMFSFPELKHFQYGENFDSILTILIAFNILQTKEKVKETTDISKHLASIDVLNLINLVSVLHYVLNDNLVTLNCFISLILKKLPNTMLISNDNQIPSTLLKDLEFEKLESQSLYLTDIKNQFDKHLLQMIPSLYNHFIQRDINSLKVIQILTGCVFSNQLQFDVLLRVIDIYIFEGDSFLLRASLALLKKISYKLYGDEKEIYTILNTNQNNNLEYLDVGEVDEFIKQIRDVLKKK